MKCLPILGLLGQQRPALFGDTTTQIWVEGHMAADCEQVTTLVESPISVSGVPRGHGLTKIEELDKQTGVRAPSFWTKLHFDSDGQGKPSQGLVTQSQVGHPFLSFTIPYGHTTVGGQMTRSQSVEISDV